MLTIAQMAIRNEQAGQCWFSKDSMRFFKTKVVGTPTAHNLFITSETNPSGKTAYTVRLFIYHSASVATVGAFNEMSLVTARTLKREIEKAFSSMGAREREVYDTLKHVSQSDLGKDCLEFSNGEKSFTVRNGIIVN